MVLKGQSNTQDQDTLGVLGVNLIYGAYYHHDNPLTLLTSLMDNLDSDSLEIDMIDFQGSAFKNVDNRLMALHLVKYGLSKVAIFNPDGKLMQPSDTLYKKSVLIERSRFRPPTLLTMNILDSAHEAFIQQPGVDEDNLIVLSEITLLNLRDRDGEVLEEDIDIEDFLHRVEILCALGKNVMISNLGEFYKLAQYLFSQTSKPVAIALGIPNLLNIFDEQYYDNLAGGILESFGRLFRHDMHLYVCPKINIHNNDLITTDNLKVQDHLRHLYRHLIENGYLINMKNIDYEHLLINSDTVLKMIRNHDSSWIDMVPEEVVNIIQQRKLFHN